MSIKHTYTLILLFIFSLWSYSQEEIISSNQNGIYSDFVADQDGKRLEGITVRVRGKNSSDITDFNGEFSIRANKGDLIILSKNGTQINSYIYDGSLHYEVKDESVFEDNEVQPIKNSPKTKRSSKSVKKLVSRTTSRNSYHQALDSANFYVKKNPSKSIEFVESALKSTTKKKEVAASYVVLADAYFNLNQFDLALSNYEVAYTNLDKSIPLQLKLAKAYYKNLNLTKSSLFYNKVINNRQTISYQKVVAYEGIATNYKAKKNYSKALQNYKKGLQLAEKHLITPKITDLNSSIAEVLSLQGNVNQSQTYMSNSIQSAKKENRKRAIIQSNKAADFYGRTNSIQEEITQRKETLKDLEEAELDEIIAPEAVVISKQKVKYDIGNALERQKDYNQAIEYFIESAADAVSVDDIETEKKAIQGLSEVYAKIGDDSNALIHYKKYTKLVDLLYQKKEKEITEAVAMGKDLLAKQNRISSLEKDRELNESKINLFKSEQNLVEENNRRQRLIIYSLIGGLLLLLLSLFYMFRSNKQRKLANNLLALKSLRSQMNPHFIFNALNSVNSFIAKNDERAANRYLTDFSTLMRSVLENSEQDFIPLEKEIELLNLYLKLEHTRFEDKFDFEINIDNSVQLDEFQIPPMLLQPYVENAVWHGLRYKKEKGLLQININQTNSETLKISISDDGIGRKKSKELKSKNQLKKKSKGMQNIRQRVAILNEMYQDKVDVSISDLNQNETGTKVVLTLKKD